MPEEKVYGRTEMCLVLIDIFPFVFFYHTKAQHAQTRASERVVASAYFYHSTTSRAPAR